MSLSSSTPVKGIYSIVGTPTTVVTQTTAYDIGVHTPGTLCASGTSTVTLTLDPAHSISLTSTDSTQNQTICDNSALTPITFDIGGGAGNYVISWDPAGGPAGMNVNGSILGKTITLQGTPNTDVTTTTVYTYTVSTTGNLNSCSEASETGSITVNPNDLITYDGTSGSRNQTVCSGSEITPIKYQLGGGATGATVLGLLPGLVYSVNASNVLTISGTVTDSNVQINNRSFTISTIGSCNPIAEKNSTNCFLAASSFQLLSSRTISSNSSIASSFCDLP